MSANNNMVWMVSGLVVLGAVGAGGWSMYYLEKQEHEARTAELAAEIRNNQRHIDSLTAKSDRLMAQAAEVEQRLEETGSVAAGSAEGTQDSAINQLQVAQVDAEQLLAERDMLRERLAVAEAEQARLAEEREMLSQNLEMIKNEHGQLGTELERMQATREQLRMDLEGTRTALDQVTAELGEKIQARERALSESTDRVKNMDAQLLEASGKISNLEQEREQIRTRFAELQQKLESDLESREVEIEQLKGDLTVIRLASDILFDPGSAELKGGGRNALTLIAAALNEFPDRHVSLEGHTDSVPISKKLQDRYATNWELSTARAARAVRYLLSHGVEPERIRAVGYGQYRPVADNDDPELRAHNRRLEIMLLPASQEVRDHSLSSN